MLHLEQHMITTSKECEQLSNERKQLEQRVKGLYEESLDLDMLDEQARKRLGYSEKNEVMVIPPAPKPSVAQ